MTGTSVGECLQPSTITGYNHVYQLSCWSLSFPSCRKCLVLSTVHVGVFPSSSIIIADHFHGLSKTVNGEFDKNSFCSMSIPPLADLIPAWKVPMGCFQTVGCPLILHCSLIHGFLLPHQMLNISGKTLKIKMILKNNFKDCWVIWWWTSMPQDNKIVTNMLWKARKLQRKIFDNF